MVFFEVLECVAACVGIAFAGGLYCVSIYYVVAFIVPVVVALLVDFFCSFIGFLGCYLVFAFLDEVCSRFGCYAYGSDGSDDVVGDDEYDEENDDAEEYGLHGRVILFVGKLSVTKVGIFWGISARC